MSAAPPQFGWIAPDGMLFTCKEWEHCGLAFDMEVEGFVIDAVTVDEDHIHYNFTGNTLPPSSASVTQAQLNTLFELGQRWLAYAEAYTDSATCKTLYHRRAGNLLRIVTEFADTQPISLKA